MHLNKSDQCFPNVFARGPLLASKFTRDSNILAQVNTVSGWQVSRTRYLCLGTDTR